MKMGGEGDCIRIERDRSVSDLIIYDERCVPWHMKTMA